MYDAFTLWAFPWWTSLLAMLLFLLCQKLTYEEYAFLVTLIVITLTGQRKFSWSFWQYVGSSCICGPIGCHPGPAPIIWVSDLPAAIKAFSSYIPNYTTFPNMHIIHFRSPPVMHWIQIGEVSRQSGALWCCHQPLPSKWGWKALPLLCWWVPSLPSTRFPSCLMELLWSPSAHFAGNGHIATSMSGDSNLFIKHGRTVSVPVKFYPVITVNIDGYFSNGKYICEASWCSWGSGLKFIMTFLAEAHMTDIRAGLVYRVQCFDSVSWILCQRPLLTFHSQYCAGSSL